MYKKVLLSGYYGFENLGDDLILETLVRQLQSWNVVPIVLSEHPEKTQAELGVDSLPRMDIPLIWQALGETDAVISGGGGLFQDVTGPASPFYYGGLIQLASWRKVPVAFFGQGVGPLTTLPGRKMTGHALRRSQLIVVRDAKSQLLVEQLSGRSAHLMGDPVWLWQSPYTVPEADKKGVGISLRPWPDLTQTAVRQLGEALAALASVRENGVNLIDCQAGADIVPLSQLEAHLKSYQIPVRWYSGPRAVAGIAASEALLAMRFHALLVGATLGLPLIAFSYDPKVRFLAAQIKIADLPLTQWASRMFAEHIKESLYPPDQNSMAALQRSAATGFTTLRSWLSV